MKILILSDVHGNRFGLEAVLNAARDQYDEVLCLGDVVGYGAHPNECCEILLDIEAQCLSGNHDAAALGLINTDWFNDIAARAIAWTRQELTPTNKNWLSSLPGALEFPEWQLQAVHGSLRNPWEEYITDQNMAAATLRLMKWPLCFFGHTHQAVAYACALNSQGELDFNDFEEAELPQGGDFDLDEEWRFLVNPGSCGQPRDGNPQARYAIADLKTGLVKIEPVDYDIESARRAIYDAGLPRALGDRLLRGR